MTFIISFLIILASLVAIVSGVWVIVGLVTELVNPSNTSEISSEVGTGSTADPQEKQNSPDLL